MCLFPSVDDFEGLVALGSVAEDGEFVVEGGHGLDADPLHHRESGSVDDGEVPVRDGLADGSRAFQTRRRDRLDGRRSAAQTTPEALRDVAPEPVPEKQPGLEEDVIRGHQRIPRHEDIFGTPVAERDRRGGVVTGPSLPPT